MDGPLAILDLLDELENVFDQPIHLCDVKPEHFGISDFGKVKFLDLDSVFLKSYLGEYSWVSNKADLISETFSLWLNSPNKSCQITPQSPYTQWIIMVIVIHVKITWGHDHF